MQLCEKYRPKTFSEIAGHAKAVAKLQRITSRNGFTGDTFWIVGPSGVGKTTIADCLAHAFCDDLDIVELNGDKCGVDAVHDAARTMHYTTLSGRMRCWIINEAHSITARAVQAWLPILDKLPDRVLVIFTTTESSHDLFGNFSGPFSSRCKTISLDDQGLADSLAERAKIIAQTEGLDGLPMDKYLALVESKRCNMRAVLQAIESGDMIE